MMQGRVPDGVFNDEGPCAGMMQGRVFTDAGSCAR